MFPVALQRGKNGAAGHVRSTPGLRLPPDGRFLGSERGDNINTSVDAMDIAPSQLGGVGRPSGRNGEDDGRNHDAGRWA